MTKSILETREGYTISDEETLRLIKKWQSILNINHWRVKISPKLPRKGNLMEIKINTKRQLAAIRISENARKKDLKDFEPLLVHELVHILLDPICDEFYQDRPDINRFDTRVEQLVEHLAHTFCACSSVG